MRGWRSGLAAIEVAAALRETELAHDLVIVGFSNEEGARGSTGTFGSLAIIGQIEPCDLEYIDSEGISIAERIERAYGSPERLKHAVWEESLPTKGCPHSTYDALIPHKTDEILLRPHFLVVIGQKI